MAEPSDLGAMVRMLMDIEEIKKLKAKYWRCVDKKSWDELAEVFAEDATADYDPKTHLEGREAILKFLKDSLGAKTAITAHGGHNPEIEITGETTARGIWALQDYLIMQPNTRLTGYGYYEDEYVKVDGRWKKKSTRITRIVEEWNMTKR